MILEYPSKRKTGCKEGHSPHLYLKIYGKRQYFCTHVEEVELTEGGIRVIECGDVNKCW